MRATDAAENLPLLLSGLPVATKASFSPESTDTQICADTGRLAAKALYMKAVIKFVAEAQAAALWVEELRGRFLLH